MRTSIITGDIIHSKNSPPRKWLPVLKRALSHHGANPKRWEIFRGDSFQVEIKEPHRPLLYAVLLKGAIKSVAGVDVRMAIGIGEKTFAAKRITESNGKAFVHSGELLEMLKPMKRTLAVKTGDEKLDHELNLYLKLASVAMDSWTPNSAEAIHMALMHPEWSQEKLGKKLGVKQNAVSTRLKRGHYEEIKELIEWFDTKISQHK